jgi:hypothetical protein
MKIEEQMGKLDRGEYRFWLSPDLPRNHIEDERGRDIFPCSLCNQNVHQEVTEPEADHTWLSCECLTAAFPCKGFSGAARPANSDEWRRLILALRCEDLSPETRLGDELTPEQLDRCRRQAEEALQTAAEKVVKIRDATEKLQSDGAQEGVSEVAAANPSARSLPEIDAAATTQGGCRHARVRST